MAFPITTRAELESRRLRLEPQLVLEIEGVETLFGAVEILRAIQIGDTDLEIGDAWRIGGLVAVEDQEDIISFEGGSSTKIEQQLRPDQGSVSSVSSVSVAIIDRKLVASRLISPGIVVEDVLGRKATLWMGLKQTSFKEDYIPIFQGIIDDIESGAGMVKMNIAHPEQLKRSDVFVPVDFLVDGSLDDSQVTIPLIDASAIPVPIPGPDGNFDETIKFYVKINEEIIQYDDVSGSDLIGCVRGQLGTGAAPHAEGDEPTAGKTAVLLDDSAINIALKLMLSGRNTFYAFDKPITRFLHPTPSTTVPNSIFFEGINLTRDYGVVAGDFLTTTSSAMGANNVSAKPILEIVVIDEGSYAIIDDVTFVEDPATTGMASFRSQYDSWGYGLGMSADQVDIEEHIFWNNFQLAGTGYRFFVDEKVNGKDFLDKEVYMPVGAFSLPRQGRCSMGYHIGPVLGRETKLLNKDNIKNPNKIKLRRTVNRNFYNAVVFRYDKLPLTGKFVSGAIEYSSESAARIPVGFRPFNINATGIRADKDGAGIASRVSARYLGRYKLAAEFIEMIEVLFRDGYTIEPGDQVLLDPTDLKITNTADGTRNKSPKTFTVVNKSLDLKTGGVVLSIIDSNFDGTERYGVVSPSSDIVSGTTTSLLIQDSYGALYPGNEGKKWIDYIGLPIIVHSPDWTFEEEVILLGIDPGNKYNLLLDPSTPLSAPPDPGFIIDIAHYPTDAEPSINALYKAAHAYQSKTVAIVSAPDATHFVVNVGDEVFFTVGGGVRVFNPDYTEDSGDLLVTGIVGQTIETSAPMGFTPTADHVAQNMPFADGGKIYRIF